MAQRVSTGIAGLDEVLAGGLLPGRAYLLRGGPGAGKTTLGFHFLTGAGSDGEKPLLVTLREPEDQMRANAKSMGLDTARVEFLDLSPTSEFFAEAEAYDIFHPADVERVPTTERIVQRVEEVAPTRIFLDSMTQFRYLASDAHQFRKQVLSFLRFLLERDATVVFTSEASAEAPDDDLRFLADGVIELEWIPELGRTIAATKFRGSRFLEGRHSMRLTDTGMQVFPALAPLDHTVPFERELITSGIGGLDDILRGGITRGTTTIISGPSGVGKTSVGMNFMKEAAARGERSVIYTFEEEAEALLFRSERIGIPVREMIDKGTLALRKVEPLQFTPDEFAQLVRREVEENAARIVMIDSMSGYRVSLQGRDLVTHLHALSKYLQNMGVATLLIDEIDQAVGRLQISGASISYLADNVIFLRYMEARIGDRLELRKGIGVLKKRLSDFDKTLRELVISGRGLEVGPPIIGLTTILGELPVWVDDTERSNE